MKSNKNLYCELEVYFSSAFFSSFPIYTTYCQHSIFEVLSSLVVSDYKIPSLFLYYLIALSHFREPTDRTAISYANWSSIYAEPSLVGCYISTFNITITLSQINSFEKIV